MRSNIYSAADRNDIEYDNNLDNEGKRGDIEMMSGESAEKNTATDDNNVKKDKNEKKNVEKVSLAVLFSTAEPLDILYMTLGVLGAAVTGFSLPLFNVLFGLILDELNSDPNSFGTRIVNLCYIFIGVAGLNLFSGYCQVSLWAITGQRQAQKLRELYVRAVLSQEVGWFDTIGAAELATKVADIVGKIEDGMGRKVGDMLQYFFQVIGSFVVGFYLGWRLTVVLITSYPIISLAGSFMINSIASAQQQSLEQYGKAGGLATEALSSVRTVTALNAQVDSINRYRVFLLEAMHVGIRKGLNVGLGNGLVFGAIFCTYGLGFWYGGLLVANDIRDGCDGNCITGGTVLAVFFSIIMGGMALGQVIPPLTAFTEARAAAVPLFKVINRKPLIDGLSNEGNVPSKALEGNISFDKIEFSYPSRPHIQVCKGYSLNIEKGETIALVGPSGCGKSTVVNLLLRFYDPQAGTVLIDGIDIKTLNTRWLRSRMGYVGQEPVLFSGTIADNISYGIDKEISPTGAGSSKYSDDKLHEEIIRAAKLANAHDFIMSFPDGYSTDVGSNGIALSGGQKQRIAIARALIKRPLVLLLDEATSALDAASERTVQESIDKLQQSKLQTTIVIAHRLSTIRNADKIAVINQGYVVEMGKHEELLAMNGLYSDLVRLQMSTGHDTEILANSRSIGSLEKLSDAENFGMEGIYSDNSSISMSKTMALSVKATSAHEANSEVVDETVVSTSEDKKQEIALSKEVSKEVSKRVWRLVLSNKGWFTVAVLGSATFGAVFPVWGYLLAQTQNSFYKTRAEDVQSSTSLLAIIYCCLGVVCLISGTAMFWGIAHVGERIAAKLRSDLYEALMRREISYFDYEENNVGALTTRLADDSRQVNKATGEAFARQVQAFFTLTIGLALAFSAAWKVAFVVLASFPVNIAASAIQLQAFSGNHDQEDSAPVPASQATASKSKTSSASSRDLLQANKDEAISKDDAEAVPNQSQSKGHGALISTAFTHMRTVSAFSMQYHVADEYADITRAISLRKIGKAHFAGLGFGGAQCSLFCTYALLFWYGSTLIESGEISFVQMMTAILCLMLGALGLGAALGDLGDQTLGLLAAKRIFEAVDEGAKSPIDGIVDEGEVPTARSNGEIQLKGVYFKYPTRPKVLVCNDYNLSIDKGEVVALVGPSGGGKSTIMNLLLRFYDPLEGQVFLDGRDITSLNVKWLRSQIGYVGQEPVLFSGTIAENIAKGRSLLEGSEQSKLTPLDEILRRSDEEVGIWGKSAAASKADHSGGSGANSNAHGNGEYHALNVGINGTDGDGHDNGQEGAADQEDYSRKTLLRSRSVQESIRYNVPADVVEAAILANAHDFITSFPHGYHTQIGEASILVSGGQKQRIAIARALIRKPAVLLLDEATSALDSASEQLVQESIDLLTAEKKQTTIIIAHRLSTIRNADRIAVIQDGKVVEMGKHDELLATDGVYSHLWRKQGGEESTLAVATIA